MYCYGYNIAFDPLSSTENSNTINLVEDYTISKENLNYKYQFENNQNREVELLSNINFGDSNPQQKFFFSIQNVLIFEWSYKNNKIKYKSYCNNDKLLKYWTLHTLLPLYFTLKNRYYFLHAGAVEIEKQPVLFIANSYGGKSTLTDFFIKKGHIMISDDKVATFEKSEKIYSVPSYPFHRPYRKTEDLGIFTKKFAKDSKSLNTIFNLIKSKREDNIIIKKISGVEKFKALRFSTDIDIKLFQKQRFKALTNIANKVDIYDITIPWDLNRLEEVYQAIVKFIKNKKVI